MAARELDEEAYAAVKANDSVLLKRILTSKPGININATNRNDYTMLHVACSKGFDACARLLLEKKANANAVSMPDKVTPLHVAASMGHTKCMELLFQYQAKVDAVDNKMVTALHAATAAGHADAVDLLLRRGSDIHLRDYKDRTPLDVAVGYKQQECHQLLLEAAGQGANHSPSVDAVIIKDDKKDPLPARVQAKPKITHAAPVAAAANKNNPVAKPTIPKREKTPVHKQHDAANKDKDNKGAGTSPDDTPVPEDAGEVLQQELAKIVGLSSVKEMLNSMYKKVLVDQRRKQFGFKSESSLNMLFLGNPGTGKTSIARVVARMLKHLGVLKKGQLVEVSRKDLVAEYSGQSASKTAAKINEAIGGVLFIDEAYSLKHEGSKDSFGQEVVDTLIAEMENHRNELVVIAAGYTKEMNAFMGSNSGLRSRFSITLEFADYSYPEMAEIFQAMVEERNLKLHGAVTKEKLGMLLQKAIPRSVATSGNARAVRNLVDSVLRAQTDRVAESGTMSMASLLTLTEEDFDQAMGGSAHHSLTDEAILKKLDAIVGVASVKEFVRGLRARMLISAEKRAKGLPEPPQSMLHMLFLGNPGTGKTTIARLVGELLRSLGILAKGQLIEVTRVDLVGEHVGETAPKTNAVITRALGGILFIDEAYALVQEGRDNFGREAMDTIMKAMEDHRDELIVILAGYPGEMDKLVASNPGLKSRFPYRIEFPDYTGEELAIIGEKMVEDMKMKLSDSAKIKLRELCNKQAESSAVDGGNARYVRNLSEAAVTHQAMRLVSLQTRSPEDLMTIEADDLN